MKISKYILFFSLMTICFAACRSNQAESAPKPKVIDFIVDAKTANIELFWKNDNGQIFGSLQNVKKSVESKGKRLRFAMNAGIYEKNQTPKGLFIQNGITLQPLDSGNGAGNFYLKPNGVFYLTYDRRALVVAAEKYGNESNIIKAAIQSGPMLVADGKINAEFQPDSTNINVRNGVGILPDGKVVFAISDGKTNLYDFALYFKNAGCQNALYLDGFVSRMYLPEKTVADLDGEFAVIIGVVE